MLDLRVREGAEHDTFFIMQKRISTGSDSQSGVFGEGQLQDIGEVEKRLWAAADQLWANTGLKPSEFSTPVLGLIFLRYAEKRFVEAETKLLKRVERGRTAGAA